MVRVTEPRFSVSVAAQLSGAMPECFQAPPVLYRRGVVPQNVKVAVIRTHFEEGGIRAIPLIHDFFDKVAMIINPETDRPFIGTVAGVALNPKSRFTHYEESL
jgi:hypothetical protein